MKQINANIILKQTSSKSFQWLLMFYAILIPQMAAILECQTAKNQNDFMHETFWYKVDFYVSHFDILVTGTNWTGLFFI